jgi:hypothetical protein
MDPNGGCPIRKNKQILFYKDQLFQLANLAGAVLLAALT